MTKRTKQLMTLCLATMMLFASCVATDSPSAVTDPPATTDEITSPNTDPATEEGTTPTTDAPTEETTDAETEPDVDPPTPENTVGDCGNVYATKSGKKVGKVRLDSVKHQFTVQDYAKAVKKTNNWSVAVEEKNGFFELRGWIGINFENFELAWRIGTHSEVAYTTDGVAAEKREPAVYQTAFKEGYTNATGYTYRLNMSEFHSGDELHLLIKDLDTDTVYCFCELTVNNATISVENLSSTLKDKYGLGNNSQMDMSFYDPIAQHEPVTAPDDDPALKLWFDHITEKVTRYDTSSINSTKNSYTIQMGKNEMEGCQFFLYSPTARKVTIKYSDFTNDKGETLSTELGVEYYIEDGYVTYHGYPASFVYPDAVVPYESYIAYSSNTENGRYGNDANSKLDYGPYVCIGPFSGSDWDHENYPFRDSIRGFVLQAESKPDSTPGAYKATVEIIDAETGKCIKMANVYTYVYDVTLSEETALDTAFALWDITSSYMHHYNEYPELHRYTDVEILRAVSDFFLKHRITLNHGLFSFNVLGEEWFENPRVTTVRVLTKEHYDSIKDNPILAEKMFYYGQDEPGVPRGWRNIGWPDGTSDTVYDNTGLYSVLAIAREADMLKNVWGWEDYRLLTPFERTIDFTKFNFNALDRTTGFPSWYDQYAPTDEKDSVEYLSKHINVWVPVYTGATPRDLATAVSGAQFMQSANQDKLSGEFQERLDGFKAEEGHELWNYVACQPPYTSPYQNILLFNDGTEGRTMFWTTYMLGGTGFLYWNVSYYDAGGNATHTLRCPFSKTGPGDGILVYPGSAYGQLDPIPSIRLVNMRDGIEDYQLLTMLEQSKGAEFTDELVSHITTSSVTYTRDDDTVYNVRSFLLRALEEAGKA